MKFSDMMGKGNKTEDADAETAAVAARLNAPPVPEVPLQFGGNRSETTTTVEVPEPAATEPAATEPAVTEPAVTEPAVTEPVVTEPAVHTIDNQVSMADVMSELVPRVGAAVTPAAPAELDASAWLDGLTIIDDDLLPL